jgi:ribosomal protein S18 acetylase RimI-like enzyme
MQATAQRVRARKAHPLDLPRVAGTLSRAFFDDPAYEWAIPHPARRRAILPGLFALFAAVLARHDEIYVSDHATGAALWVPPGHSAMHQSDADEFGQRMDDLVGVYRMRMDEISAAVDPLHPRVPHYYLNFLAVDPVHQGQGIGSALIAPMLERCDREGVPAYLEASNFGNVRFYERHGFVLARELVVPEGPTLYAMWRNPEGRS